MEKLAYLGWLFFGFKGRIGRLCFLLASLLVITVSLAGEYILDPAFFDLEAPPRDEWPMTQILPVILWSLLSSVPIYALMVKRLMDRNWSIKIIVAACCLYLALHNAILTIEFYKPFFEFLMELNVNILRIIFTGICLLVIPVAIDNLFLKGTTGPNQYGADPLEKTE